MIKCGPYQSLPLVITERFHSFSKKAKKQSNCIDIELQRHALQKQISLAPTKICFMLPVKEFKHFGKALFNNFVI